jgi:hypothetical protein
MHRSRRPPAHQDAAGVYWPPTGLFGYRRDAVRARKGRIPTTPFHGVERGLYEDVEAPIRALAWQARANGQQGVTGGRKFHLWRTWSAIVSLWSHRGTTIKV